MLPLPLSLLIFTFIIIGINTYVAVPVMNLAFGKWLRKERKINRASYWSYIDVGLPKLAMVILLSVYVGLLLLCGYRHRL